MLKLRNGSQRLLPAKGALTQKKGFSASHVPHVPHLPPSESPLSARTVSPLALAKSALRRLRGSVGRESEAATYLDTSLGIHVSEFLRLGSHSSRAAYAAGHLEHAEIVHEITGRKRDRQFVAPELLHALGTDDTPATDEEPFP